MKTTSLHSNGTKHLVANGFVLTLHTVSSFNSFHLIFNVEELKLKQHKTHVVDDTPQELHVRVSGA